jgi:Fur family ferric uptake transcriptional regulator
MKMKVKIKKQDEMAEFQKCKKEQNLKTSQKRLSIVNYFLKKDRHFTVEELYNEIKKTSPQISYATVYRALRLLTAMGLARVCQFKGKETRFEPVHRSEHHDHLICIKCGKIVEFSQDEIEKLQKQVAARHRFKVESHRLELYGLCEGCAQKEKGK